ncbi:acyl-CoA dehydrogenase family protein [Amycolatopsis sp. NPDC004169]|uniref:acyl-CoA dehydrogenase family protein n=1 Tax=Amycolatopsis sp. NPDC004169 TaxID=3154453 RepID=UPI0033A35BFE
MTTLRYLAATPTDTGGWLARAREVATVLASDAVARDRASASPCSEIALLRDSGLVTLLGSTEHGGGGQNWTAAYQVIREIAAGDGCIGQLIGYHFLWFWAARTAGTPDQIAAVEEQATRERWLFGGAVNPQDDTLVITEEGDKIVFNGWKLFSLGSKACDVTVLAGVLQGSGEHIFAVVPTLRPGIVFGEDWDSWGHRPGESRSVEIRNVRVPRAQTVRHSVDAKLRADYRLLQLVFTNFYLGVAKGALATAAAHTRDKMRTAPCCGDVEDPAGVASHIVEGYGELQAKLWAAEALAVRAAEAIERSNDQPEAVTAEERGEVAVVIAAAHQRAVDTGLEIGARVFELTGARASANTIGLDIYWRNIRTHSLLEPIAARRVDIGRYALLGEIPEVTW